MALFNPGINFLAGGRVIPPFLTGGLPSDFLLRDIAVLGSDQTFDEFVAEASEMSGLGLVIKTETLNLSGSAEPEVASDVERNGDRPRASRSGPGPIRALT